MTTMNGQARGWIKSKETFETDTNEADADRFEDLVDIRTDNEEFTEQLLKQYTDERDAHERRFILRSTLITAFAHGGAFFSTDWTIEGQFVFREMEFGPADLLVAESQNHGSIAILAVAMTSEEENVFDRVQRLCEYVSDNISSIEGDLDTVLADDDVAGTIALYGVDRERVSNAVDDAGGDDWSPVSVWELQSGDDSGDSERLTLATWDDTDHPLNFVPGGGLGTKLENKGLPLIDTKHIQIDQFSDSHHEKLFKNLYVWLFHQHAGRDKTNSYFSEEDLIKFLTESADQPTRQEAKPRAQDLIEWWYELDMVKPAPNPDNYDEEETVHSIVGRMRMSDIIDKKVEEYRAAVIEALIKKDLREDFPTEGMEEADN
ncbi:hypothetical protein SAMN05421858_4299 [Haladaptatus litoreus]|uniref:Uncharacterized protein n=1 Tax=Haladaptatus litoreus TaxID=553468 RepID=A0A1N7EJ14_9EURY|nr:hypothetical protein [Haladaptatus litoreus]SIR88091.1 hypothetical protein SAMN05421858_4299 [Haladaptatus litoreus]